MSEFPECKQGVVKEHWLYLHPKVREIFEFCEIAFSKRDVVCLITSMIRPKTTDTGIHATGRALDFVLRTPSGGNQTGLMVADCAAFASFFSKVFVKYKRGPAVIFHDVGLGYHFHVQVEADPKWVDLNGEPPVGGGPTEAPIELPSAP